MILHLSHIFFTDALTFISTPPWLFYTSTKTYIFYINGLISKYLYIYFALHVILPLVKSYGESSTLTLSPGKIFI